MMRRIVLAAATACIAAQASAQSPPAAAAGPAPAQQPAGAPRAWVVSCADAPPDQPRECRVAATAIAQPQNQRVLTVALLRQPETRSLALTFQVPHGVALPAGVT